MNDINPIAVPALRTYMSSCSILMKYTHASISSPPRTVVLRTLQRSNRLIYCVYVIPIVYTSMWKCVPTLCIVVLYNGCIIGY